ncbi:uncharacterized protein LOC134782713 [Penaeus indicus]|uniref:uncharacterized protein LOC134782713 n=1 Tax=Penaeus indicus TaxID=29960 RepID=UPI00300D65EF
MVVSYPIYPQHINLSMFDVTTFTSGTNAKKLVQGSSKYGSRSSASSCSFATGIIIIMKVIVLAMFVAAALADKPSFSYDAPASRPSGPVRVVEIVRDDRIHPAADGSYTFDVETEDGIVRHEAGGPGGAQQGSVSLQQES